MKVDRFLGDPQVGGVSQSQLFVDLIRTGYEDNERRGSHGLRGQVNVSQDLRCDLPSIRIGLGDETRVREASGTEPEAHEKLPGALARQDVKVRTLLQPVVRRV